MCIRALCALCGCCLCAALAAIVACAAWLSHLELPTAGVAEVKFASLVFSPNLSLDIDATLWIDNPNPWPMSGTIVSAEADMFSLDKNDRTAPMLFLGTARLPSRVTIATQANTSFHVRVLDVQTGGDAGIVGRLTADCGVLAHAGTTMVGVNVTRAEVSIWNENLVLDHLGIFFNATVPCPQTELQGSRATRNVTANRMQNDSALLVV